jgi:multidrug transporter EmrE-like cation transporter
MARTISPCELLLLRPKAHQALPKIMLSMLQCWVILVACIASATAGSLCIKASNVYQQLVPSILMFVFFVVAVAGFPFAFSRIDLGTAYAGMLKKENMLSRSLSFSSNGRLAHFVVAVWAGIGTVSTALIGIFYFQEKAAPLKICGISLIIAGVIMLNFSEAGKVGVSDGMESTGVTESSMEDMVDAAASGADGV